MNNVRSEPEKRIDLAKPLVGVKRPFTMSVLVAYKFFGERMTDEQRYLHEFDIVSWKLATRMSHLTEEEIKLWGGWIALQCWGSTHIEDFFSPAKKGKPFFEAIQVRVWKWTHLVDGEEKVDHLIDMSAWPDYREDELGAIFLNGQFVLENVHGELYVVVQSPLELISRTGSLNHLRTMITTRNCQDVSKRSKDLGSS